jgi:hypothetical protein
MKCQKNGCPNEAASGSSYCIAHRPSTSGGGVREMEIDEPGGRKDEQDMSGIMIQRNKPDLDKL